MLITEAVQVWREADGDYHIQWEATHPETRVTVEPLAEPGSAAVGYNTHYREAPQRGVRFSGLAPGNRHFFRLRDQHGTEVVATARRLGMHGAPNFRDLGGYPAADGRRVKWGYLFRSGQLSRLSDPDLDLMASLELDLVCDFRRAEEQLSDPSRLPPRRPRVASLPIDPGSHLGYLEEAAQQRGGRQAMFELMREINRDLAEGRTETYARMFREILEIEGARVLVHCAAGKDRAGFAAAIILLALGVSREEVMRDYMLTGLYYHPQREVDRLRAKYGMEHVAAEAVLPMLEVHEDYLQRALQAIEDNYDSLACYLHEALGLGPVELAELRSRYLQD